MALRDTRLVRLWGSPAVTVVLLFLLFGETILGTFLQQDFTAWLWFLGPVPWPGLPLFCGLALVHGVFSVLRHLRFQVKDVGLWCLHGGVFLFLLGGLAVLPPRSDLVVGLKEGGTTHQAFVRDSRAPRDLPFELTLKKFSAATYPQSQTFRDFRSEIEVQDRVTTKATVSLNDPFRYRGWTIFQNSYRRSDKGEWSSVFLLVRDDFEWLIYVAAALTVAGFLFHWLLFRRGT